MVVEKQESYILLVQQNIMALFKRSLLCKWCPRLVGALFALPHPSIRVSEISFLLAFGRAC